MFRSSAIILFLLLVAATARGQQITVNPVGVNVNSQGATTAFLTFGPLGNYRPADACWCGELIPAAPDIGFKCDPATILGCLPARYDRSTLSGQGAFTDIMSIPPSVARRAYQQAQAGLDSRFFYVRRFISTTGGPDQFVAVTCRLTGGGARAPLSLTDVKLSFDSDKSVLMVRQNEEMPRLKAEISYTGTGRLKGRWEVVLPGEELPTVRDRLTEATLPVEERPLQRRYTQLARFNVFLPPTGKLVLEGPDPSRIPNKVEGPYLILLRVEASDDKEADSDLSAVGAGPSVVHSGAVAGFPLPPLRYYVGSGSPSQSTATIELILPQESEIQGGDKPVDFKWSETARAALYRLEIASGDGSIIFSALLPPGSASYRAPSWATVAPAGGNVRWRVIALDDSGNTIGQSDWRAIRIATR